MSYLVSICQMPGSRRMDYKHGDFLLMVLASGLDRSTIRDLNERLTTSFEIMNE